MDADVRFLGTHPMSDVIMDFENIPKNKLGRLIDAAEPVRVSKASDISNSPIFSLVAA